MTGGITDIGLFENHPDPMLIYHTDSLRVLEVNPAAIARYGYSRAEFLELGLADLHPPEDLAPLQQRIAAIEPTVASSGSWRHRLRSGAIIPVDITSYPLQFQGLPARLVTARDISQLQAQAASLRHAQQLLVVAGKVAGLGGWRVLVDEAVVEWSAETAAIFGRPDLRRLSLDQAIECYTPATRPGIRRAIRDCISRGEAFDEVLQIATASGELRWLRSLGEAERDSHGRITAIHGAFQDVTEQRTLDERLRQSQKLQALGQLTGGVAHDFNNLLTVILGNTELLAELLEDPNLRSLATLAASAAERGAALTNRLLAFARKQALQPQRADLNGIISQMQDLLRRTLSANIDLEFALAEGLGVTEVDPVQLETALLNLAINARDAMPAGGSLTIETGNTYLDEDYARANLEVSPGPYVMVSVSDSGCGMSRDVVASAFDPFFTTKEAGKGNGLGLSMIYGFVKQSGGHARIYSELDVGTTVKLYFRRVADKGEVLRSLQPPPETVVRGTEHLLVVEDDAQVRTHVTTLLDNLGYRVSAVGDAEAALVALAQHRDIELLFTDVVMPGGMNGKQLADAARQLYPRLRVLFTSGYTENAIVHGGRLDAGVQLLSKPYHHRQLAAKLREVLDPE